jgi:hypothetical protein
MRTIQKILLTLSLSLLLPLAASAQSIGEFQDLGPEERRAYMESMSDDERTAMREKWRSEFDNLPEEEKQAMRDKRAERRGAEGGGRDREAMRERRESMSEEERTAAREKRRASQEQRRERWDSMSDEERAAAREKYGQRKGPRGDHKKDGKHDGARQEQQPET